MTEWFSDIDVEAEGTFLWQPCVDLKGLGIISSLSIWFATQAECDAFIEEHFGSPVLRQAI
jgi:hypothetical protein